MKVGILFPLGDETNNFLHLCNLASIYISFFVLALALVGIIVALYLASFNTFNLIAAFIGISLAYFMKFAIGVIGIIDSLKAELNLKFGFFISYNYYLKLVFYNSLGVVMSSLFIFFIIFSGGAESLFFLILLRIPYFS